MTYYHHCYDCTSNQIIGTITDDTGAAISNAAVIIVNTATSAECLTRSNSSGIYAFTDLTFGDYHVKISHPSFGIFETEINISSLAAHLNELVLDGWIDEELTPMGDL